MHDVSINGVTLSDVITTRAEIRSLIRSLSLAKDDIAEIEKRAMRKFNLWENSILKEQRRVARENNL